MGTADGKGSGQEMKKLFSTQLSSSSPIVAPVAIKLFFSEIVKENRRHGLFGG